MEPWQSWTIVGVIGAGAYLYYTRSSRHQRGRSRLLPILSQTPQQQASPPRDGGRARKRKPKSSTNQEHSDDIEDPSKPITAGGDTKADSNGGARSSKLSPQFRNSKGTPAQQVRHEPPIEQKEKVTDLDNQEFAKQMAEVRSGALLGKGGDKSSKTPRKKNSTHLGTPVPSSDFSRASSTAGVDADDDASPATSPEMLAAKPAGDVSDMLERPGKGPSVIRLTELPKEQAVKVKKPKVEQPVETKKQRQRRRQKEDIQELRKESEKERRIKLENQLRTARIAEGRPAKDGTASMLSPVPSVWTNTGNGNVISAPSENVALLDTFESDGVQHQKASPATDATSASDRAWEQENRSEEEQMRLINELDGDGWSTVEKGGRPKKKKTNGLTDSSGTASVATTDDGPNIATTDTNDQTHRVDAPASRPLTTSVGSVSKSATAKEPIDPTVWNRANIHNHPDYNPEHPWALTGHPEDSDWSVV